MKRGMKKWKLNSTAKIMKSVLICGDEYIHICKEYGRYNE